MLLISLNTFESVNGLKFFIDQRKRIVYQVYLKFCASSSCMWWPMVGRVKVMDSCWSAFNIVPCSDQIQQGLSRIEPSRPSLPLPPCTPGRARGEQGKEGLGTRLVEPCKSVVCPGKACPINVLQHKDKRETIKMMRIKMTKYRWWEMIVLFCEIKILIKKNKFKFW